VHLRNFYSPALGELMYAIRKSDLKKFKCRSEDVCRIEEGSTNAYLIHDRAVEEFLRGVEPKYNAAVAKLRNGEIDSESIFAIAGFTAYVTCCSPAAMRIHSRSLQNVVAAEAAILDRQGLLPEAPESLGSKSLSELLADGTVRISVDKKFPQALGITTITGRTSKFGNSAWEILQNGIEDSPFFTSDYPVALEPIGTIPNWIVPLTPDLAVRIVPDVRLSRAPDDLTFSGFNFHRREVARREVVAINRLLAQCAEDTVFYRDDREWIAPFVKKNRYYFVAIESENISVGTGFLNMNTQQIVRRPPDAKD
jgi:hypothetical protein